jgi:uncharacterized protein YkwD
VKASREYPAYPDRPRTGWNGRHRTSIGISRYLPVIAGVLLMVVALAGAMFSPVLAGWTGDDAQAGRPGDAEAGNQVLDRDGPDAAGPISPSAPSRPVVTPPSQPSAPPRPTATRPRPVSPTPSRPAAPANTLAAFEDEVLALTNAERAKVGCAALRLNTALRTAARNHSTDMARNNYFSHTGRNGSSPGDRMRAAGYDTSRGWAENIAAGYRTPAAVMDGWMNSTGHRNNILNCNLRALGVGAARVGTGQIYWTQAFGGR